MSDEPDQPGGNESAFPGLLWLFCAFIPAILAVASLKMNQPDPMLFSTLAVIDVVCSFAAAIGLLRKASMNEAARFLLILFLGAFFSVLNIVITIFIGCSGMGRIAP